MNDNGSVYKRGDGRWCAKYKDANDQWRYIYRKTKKEAKQALREALKDRDDGISPSKLTINDVLTTWLEDSKHEVSERTMSNRESLIRVHIANHPIGTTRLSELKHEHLRDYLRSKQELSRSSRTKLLSFLKHAASEGVRLRVLRFNPVDSFKAPPQHKDELSILSREQINHLLHSVRGHRYELIVVLGATCALRVGEALAITWDDINFVRGTLQISHTIWRGRIYPPKTRASRRTLKLPQRALEPLKRRRTTNAGFLCPTNTGKPTDTGNFHAEWKAILESVGLPRETTFHALRHGAASLLLNQNVPVPVVSKYLGHANPGITLAIYSHMIDGMGGMAASGMDDALG